MDSTAITAALHAMAPELVIWECDLIVYRAGWLQQGIVGPAQLGTSGYLFEPPDDLAYRRYWELIWDGKLAEAIAFADESGLDRRSAELGSWFVRHPGSRPPQGVLPEEAKTRIRTALQRAGMAGKAAVAA